MLELSAAEARMLALSGLGMRGVPTAHGGKATAADALRHLGLFQIDSVNVFERAHYMPAFSRVGAYDKDALGLFKPLNAGDRSEFVEYWAHEASVILTEDLPLYKWRMDKAKNTKGRTWQFLEANRDLSHWIVAELNARGPLSVTELDHDRNKRKGTWWGWSDVKRVLEAMFMFGELTSAGRDNFSRRYALPEQVLPQSVIERLATADNLESRKTLLRQAINVLAVANVKDLNDYHRQWGTYSKPEFDRAVADLVEEGTLTPVKVPGWKDKHFAGPRALRELEEATPGSNPTTILSPFDPVVWNRDRATRLFDFDYKIEIYVPQDKRVFGYYSLPILHNRKLVGRIDLKSDRQAGILVSQAAWAEEWADAKQIDSIAAGLAKNLREAQKWQGLASIRVEPAGTLSAALKAALA
ncbi:MAG: YcaQ family DNA glycosylase [Actinomycetales bacterium]|nr:YcaQ family DNA glycosylase [Actinomycetales bacterium]